MNKKLLALVIIALLVGIVIGFSLTQLVNQTESRWTYYGVVVPPDAVKAVAIKDPEFVRYPNHTIFTDNGRFYIVASVNSLTGVLRTGTLFCYESLGSIRMQTGKVAPFCLYNPDDGKFYLFYSDWNQSRTIKSDIEYARLGLAVGTNITDPSSFQDWGYLTIEGSPLPDLNAGWDPYIVKVNDVFYLLFSTADHGVHLATSTTLGTTWNYYAKAINARLENPAIFQLKSKWYMMIGIWDGDGYDLYTSDNFINWTLKEQDWFKDPEQSKLPAGSTVILINDKLYHLYQTLSDPSAHPIKGPFSLSLASIKTERLAIYLTEYFFIQDSNFTTSLNGTYWGIEAWHQNPDSISETRNGMLQLFYNETTGNYYGNSGVFQGRHTDGRYTQHQLLVGDSPDNAYPNDCVIFPRNIESGRFWLETKFKITMIGFNRYPTVFHPDYSRVNLGITLMCAINNQLFNLDTQTLWLDVYFAGYCLNTTNIWVIPKNEHYVAYNVYTDPNTYDNDVHAGYFVGEVNAQDFGKWIELSIDIGDYISKTIQLITQVNIKTIRVYGFILFVECLGAYAEVEYDYVNTIRKSP